WVRKQNESRSEKGRPKGCPFCRLTDLLPCHLAMSDTSPLRVCPARHLSQGNFSSYLTNMPHSCIGDTSADGYQGFAIFCNKPSRLFQTRSMILLAIHGKTIHNKSTVWVSEPYRKGSAHEEITTSYRFDSCGGMHCSASIHTRTGGQQKRTTAD